MDNISFILACESGDLTQEQFDEYAQSFVDSGIWRSLQGSWQRTVHSWVEAGLVSL